MLSNIIDWPSIVNRICVHQIGDANVKMFMYTYCIVRHTSEMIQWDSWIIVLDFRIKNVRALNFVIQITENLFCTFHREIIKIITKQLILSQHLQIIPSNIHINTGSALSIESISLTHLQNSLR